MALVDPGRVKKQETSRSNWYSLRPSSYNAISPSKKRRQLRQSLQLRQTTEDSIVDGVAHDVKFQTRSCDLNELFLKSLCPYYRHVG